MRDHLRAVGVLAAGFVVLCLGTPGFDFMKRNDMRTTGDRAKLAQHAPEPVVQGVAGLYWLNRTVRLPIADRLEWIQKPVRGAQNWNLYRDGPSRVRRLEIWVDGELLYRSKDADHDWLEPQLTNRRVRPMVESTTMKTNSKNWRGLTRFIVHRALQDHPDAQHVELRCTAARFPGDAEPVVRHTIHADAPDWVAVQTQF
jgi:hypothetical protein